MPKTHYVTREQILAAQLHVKIGMEDGLEIDPIVLKIANAKPARDPSSPDEDSDDDTTQD